MSISGGDAPGEITTSLTDVTQSTLGQYILNDSTGFNAVGTGPLVAIAGDATGGANEDKDPGTYYFMAITWNVSGTRGATIPWPLRMSGRG